MDTDICLMLRAKDGDSSAFEALVRMYHAQLVGYLFHRVFNYAAAEELAQDTFFRAYRARERYEATAKFGTWIYRIAQRLAINWVRDQKARRMLPFERSGRPLGQRQLVDPSSPL
jgi:RNA polymerase sigma-70 factor (ECF subfamily)